MQDFDPARLMYLLILAAVIGFSFLVHNRGSFGKLAQQALTWGLIFLGVIAAIGLWDDIRQSVHPTTEFGVNGQIELPRSADGHFYVTLRINNAPILFVVDTGASDIVLARQDAQSAGIDPTTLAFTGRANTANGQVRTALIRLKEVTLGTYSDQNLRAVVNQGDMETSLLGMTYLQRFSSIQILRNAMILAR